jgi:hypothetical protein
MQGLTKDAPRMAAMARTILTVVDGQSKVTNTAATEYAVLHQDTLERYLPIARRYTQAVGAAFCWAHMMGWSGVEEAANRLLELNFDPGDDPMKAFAKKAEDMRKFGQGSAAVKQKFDAALAALKAVNEGKELKQIRSWKPNYAEIERESMRPPAHDRQQQLDAVIEYENVDEAQDVPPRASKRPPKTSLAYDPEEDGDE